MRSLRRGRTLRVLLGCIAALAITGGVAASSALASPFARGDVFAAIGNSKVNVFDPTTGVMKQQLNDLSGSTFTTGMCIDDGGNLYVTNFSAGNVSKFDNTGALLNTSYVSGLPTPESCVFDGAGNLFVGTLSGGIYKYSPTGTFLHNYAATATGGRVDWLDLSADQCTMLYTIESGTIFRYDVCADAPLSDFATGLPSPCYALRIRDNGDVMAACQPVQRLSSTGTVIQAYPALTNMFALNLDPDGTSFWTGITGGSTDDIFRADIATGTVLKNFSSNSETGLFGLAVYGEATVAAEGPPGDPSCSNTLDDDGDGLADQDDPGCQSPEGPAGDPNCSDSIDNDGDGFVDAADTDCQSTAVEGPFGDPTCSDTVDNDADGFVDAADPGCAPPPANPCKAPGAIIGTNGNDNITGTPGDDIICAKKGNDVVHGLGGNDIIIGAEGNDQLYGEAGNDDIRAGAGADRVYAGDDDDVVHSGADNDRVDGGAGDDVIHCDGGDDYVAPRTGNDRVSGDGGNDRLNGGVGNDVVSGGGGDDVIDGSSGDDSLDAGAGNDNVTAGPGVDLVKGGADDDHINSVDNRADTVKCNTGTDSADVDGLDSVSGCEATTVH